MKKIILLTTSLLILGACANTRDPRPMEMTAVDDKGMTCSDIEIEYRANTSAADRKISKNKSDDTMDVVVGLLIWPGLADFKNADGIEGNAMLDRNVYL